MPGLLLGDETTTIIVNGTATNTPGKLGEFIQYVNGKISGEFSMRLDSAVNDVRRNHEWRKTYMKWEMNLWDAKAEGRTEGRAEIIYELVSQGDCSIERGAEKLGISVETLCTNMQEAGYSLPRTE